MPLVCQANVYNSRDVHVAQLFIYCRRYYNTQQQTRYNTTVEHQGVALGTKHEIKMYS